MFNVQQNIHGDLICVPQKWLVYATKIVFTYICQTQDFQIPIFAVYTTTDVQSTNVKTESSVMDICHCFAIYITVFCETRYNPDAPNDLTHTHLCVPVDVMIIASSIIF